MHHSLGSFLLLFTDNRENITPDKIFSKLVTTENIEYSFCGNHNYARDFDYFCFKSAAKKAG